MLETRRTAIYRAMWPYFPDLLAQPVPRYTSYPTAVEFDEGVGAQAQGTAIRAVQQPVSLYLHIPFCDQICWYCGCNTGAANRTQRLASYLDALDQEVASVAGLLPKNTPIGRIAFGGGSPNAIAPLAFVRLLDRVMTAFGAASPDISVEVDPRGLTPEWVRVLGATGVTHVSMGVQTLSPDIQARIGRVQPHQMIAGAIADLREVGVRSINFDLMYGLPGQSLTDLTDTLDASVAMAPERIALFGYAHVPHLLPRQRRIDASALPDQAARFAMAAAGYAQLMAAGYVAVGFDHFALPHDALARAAGEGCLRRNFQGFTDDQADVLLGMGASAISNFPDLIVQNEKNAGRYRMLVSGGRLAGERGVWRSVDDTTRGRVIEDVLCARPTDLSVLGDASGVTAGLAPFIAHGLIEMVGTMLVPTDSTRPYARAIAVLFDSYRKVHKTTFSSAI
ncbi:MAG: oxygen-independent coproporphyrinogen III oxidase [Sphingopyxis sp.]